MNYHDYYVETPDGQYKRASKEQFERYQWKTRHRFFISSVEDCVTKKTTVVVTDKVSGMNVWVSKPLSCLLVFDGGYQEAFDAACAWLSAVWPMWREDYAYMGGRVEISNEPSDPAVVIS